jgi:hypothetical protein
VSFLRDDDGVPRIEVPRADELAAGLAAPLPAPSGPVDRGRDGQVQPGSGARELGRRGGLARARRRAEARGYASSFGLGRLLSRVTDERVAPALADDKLVAPFIVEGEAWLAAQVEAVARDVGGGQLSPGVISILRTAAWQRTYSALLFDATTRRAWAWDGGQPRTELLLVATRLGDSSRQNLLAAHELAAREAAARPAPTADLAALGWGSSDDDDDDTNSSKDT